MSAPSGSTCAQLMSSVEKWLARIAACARSTAECSADSGPAAAAGAVVGVRALSDYDDLFDLTPSADPTPRPDLRIIT